jgi:tetrahydromethanopterin S-methyltransferase subunit B
MDVFTMVVIIVAISCGAGMYSNYLKSRKHVGNNNSDELLVELDALRERIEVLEKIVTDQKYVLHKEISDLERSA